MRFNTLQSKTEKLVDLLKYKQIHIHNIITIQMMWKNTDDIYMR